MVEYVLCHHGVKGQKWGVRRYQNPDGSLTAAGRKREAKLADREIKRQRRQDSKNRRMMSDSELKEKIGRLESEKRLRELTEQEVFGGETATKKFLKDVGSNILSNLATSLITGGTKYAVKYFMTKEFDWSEAAAYVVPKPKK